MITIYTTPTCVYCKQAKEYFKANNIEYTEINVVDNDAAIQEMVRKSGQMGVPVIDINGQVFVGFNRPEIAKALGK